MNQLHPIQQNYSKPDPAIKVTEQF